MPPQMETTGGEPRPMLSPTKSIDAAHNTYRHDAEEATREF
jgi:hypothetical protein